MRAVLTVVVLAVGMGSAQARGPESFAPVVKRVLPAVVSISVTETVAGPDPSQYLPPDLARQFRQKRRSMSGAGSGFIIDASGIIVTNDHVVGRADRIIVTLSDGHDFPAKVIGIDELTDIAVVKIEAGRSLPTVSWGDSRHLEIGDWVIAAGNPFGLGGSVTAGIISARGRDIGTGPFNDFIQIDAPINPGNSGGPVFDTEGEVVGVNTAIVSPTGSSVGIGFAIPAESASRIVEQLRSRGRIERGWLGVSVQDLPTQSGDRGAVGIAGVDRAGPAAKAGLRAGDTVTAVNGAGVESAKELIRVIAAVTPGDRVRLTVRRSGRELDVPLAVGRRPAEQQQQQPDDGQ